MFWTDLDHSFCESKLLGLPEYINSITSIFLSLFGIYGLYNKNNDIFIDILYSILFITGIGSFGYHYNGNIGWALFDEIPMILLIFLSIIYVNNIHNQIIINSIKNKIIYKIKLIINLFLMILFIICNTMINFRLLFPYFFTLISIYLFYEVNKLLYFVEKNIIYIYYNNIKIILLSALIWVITEIPCKYVNYKILLLGHPLWYLLIGYGFYNLLQIIYFIKLSCLHNNEIIYDLQYNRCYLLNIKNINV